MAGNSFKFFSVEEKSLPAPQFEKQADKDAGLPKIDYGAPRRYNLNSFGNGYSLKKRCNPLMLSSRLSRVKDGIESIMADIGTLYGEDVSVTEYNMLLDDGLKLYSESDCRYYLTTGHDASVESLCIRFRTANDSGKGGLEGRLTMKGTGNGIMERCVLLRPLRAIFDEYSDGNNGKLNLELKNAYNESYTLGEAIRYKDLTAHLRKLKA